MHLTESPSRPTPSMKSQLNGIWRQNLPIIRDRLDRLDAFVVIANQGDVTPQQHSDALNIAHKMAGSLGIFGFAAAGDVAHDLEVALRSSGPIDTIQLHRLNTSLRLALKL